ncbi:tetratricopeptide repeat protein [Streptomyces aureoverticillatus]|uniref:tetratricopeptide repeat protein n=1 Tax=Streptomyces aureoverticillatus TaxID=66871 RepID=UPI001952AEC3|nr:tetratricopeptide repeat protein [Streptomyces aureoverticillatus]
MPDSEELGFWTDAADRLTGPGTAALLTGDFPRATQLHRKAMALAAEHGYAAGEIRAEIGLALGARREGDFDLAYKHLRRSLAWHREVDFGPGPAFLLAELGFLAEQRNDAPTALTLHHQGLSVARDSGDPRALALAHEGLAGAHTPSRANLCRPRASWAQPPGPGNPPARLSLRPSAAMSSAS